MKRLDLDSTWPQSWQDSHFYDEMEIYGVKRLPGYTYAYESRRKHTLELVRQAAPPPAKVLDLAAAQGNFSLSLAELGYDVTWNDLRAELADYVRLKHERGTVNYAPGNAFDLGYESHFDIVLITEIIEHVAHPDEFLSQVARMVKPGGHVVMTTPSGKYLLNKLPKFSECPDPSQFESVQFKPNSDGHIFLLHDDEIASLAQKAGLSVETTRLFTNPLTAGHLKTSPLLKVLPRPVVSAVEATSRVLPAPARRKLHTGMAVLFSRPN